MAVVRRDPVLDVHVRVGGDVHQPSRRPRLSAFIASFAVGVGGTGWLLQGDVFPTAVRGQAASTGATVDWLANFALIEVSPSGRAPSA